MLDWKSEAIRLRLQEGLTWGDLVERFKDRFPDLTLEQARNKVRDAVRRDPKGAEKAGEKRDKITFHFSKVANYSCVNCKNFERYFRSDGTLCEGCGILAEPTETECEGYEKREDET